MPGCWVNQHICMEDTRVWLFYFYDWDDAWQPTWCLIDVTNVSMCSSTTSSLIVAARNHKSRLDNILIKLRFLIPIPNKDISVYIEELEEGCSFNYWHLISLWGVKTSMLIRVLLHFIRIIRFPIRLARFDFITPKIWFIGMTCCNQESYLNHTTCHSYRRTRFNKPNSRVTSSSYFVCKRNILKSWS